MEHYDISNNSMVAMITSKFNTSGTVSVPGLNWSQNFTVAANAVVLVTLPGGVENQGSEMIRNRGIQVTALAPISLYIHQYHGFRSEATVVLPTNSLGRDYYVMTYRGVVNNGREFPAEFMIVGTEDETLIDISLTSNTKGGRAIGETFTIELDRGETYQVQSSSAVGDMTGTLIWGDKDFALFGGNVWTEVPNNCAARDNLLEQMFPIDTWGKKVVLVPTDKMNNNRFRVLAAVDNTELTITGTTSTTYNLNAGEFLEQSTSVPLYFESNHPIQVAQFIVGSDCNGYNLGDPSMVLLNSVEQTRDTVTLYNSSFENISENYINIITSTDDAPFVTIDGQDLMTTGAIIGTLGPTDEFTYARLQVNAGAHTIIGGGCGVIATAYGYGQVESYAYSGGASFKSINANPIPEGGCLNDTILFDTGLPESRYSFSWDLGDGTTSTESVFSHFYPNLGSYPVELIITDECLGTRDTLNRHLMITLRQAVEAAGDTVVCEGTSFNLAATDLTSARFEWTGPNNYFSEEQFPTLNNSNLDMSGTYAVIGIISGCATFPAFAEVEIQENPIPDLGPDTIFCNEENQTTLNPGLYESYIWQNGSVAPLLRVFEEGEYWVSVTDQFGCSGSDSVFMRKICPTRVYVPNVFSPNFDGTNDYFYIYGKDIISIQLRVFNRWGAVLFETNDPGQGWDGTFRGEEVQNGVYTWQLELEGYREDGNIYTEVRSGTVTLLR